MNIAMFSDTYYPRINGVTISVKSYAESLTELGHNVCIVCCNYEKPTRENHYHKFYYDENENEYYTTLTLCEDITLPSDMRLSLNCTR